MKTATIVNDLSGSELNGVKVKVVAVMPPSTMFGFNNGKTRFLKNTPNYTLYLCEPFDDKDINRFYDRKGGIKVEDLPKGCISFMKDDILYKGDDVFSEEELLFDE